MGPKGWVDVFFLCDIVYLLRSTSEGHVWVLPPLDQVQSSLCDDVPVIYLQTNKFTLTLTFKALKVMESLLQRHWLDAYYIFFQGLD